MRSQTRQAQRKAQREANQRIKKMEDDLNRELRAAERRTTRKVGQQMRKSERTAREGAEQTAKRQQRQLSQRTRPRAVTYTSSERRYLGRVQQAVAADPDAKERARDAFLCHAWANRKDAAAELYEALQEEGIDVWFSEEDVALGESLPRQLDRGIARSRIGIVLVTPELLASLRDRGFAEQERGALLNTGRVVPVCHEVSFAQLEAESPLLASRAGLSTEGSDLADAAAKIAESLLS